MSQPGSAALLDRARDVIERIEKAAPRAGSDDLIALRGVQQDLKARVADGGLARDEILEAAGLLHRGLLLGLPTSVLGRRSEEPLGGLTSWPPARPAPPVIPPPVISPPVSRGSGPWAPPGPPPPVAPPPVAPLVAPPVVAPPPPLPVAPPPVAPPPVAPPPVAPPVAPPVVAPPPPLPVAPPVVAPPVVVPPPPLPVAPPVAAPPPPLPVAPPAVAPADPTETAADPVPALSPTATLARSGDALTTALRATGVILILFVLYALYGTAMLEGQAQHDLGSAQRLHISAPEIGLDDVVVNGDSIHALTEGPGTVPGSAQPGASGPIMIVGHRTTYGAPFGHISDLKPGELVTLSGATGQAFAYVVTTIEHATPNADLSGLPPGQLLVLVSANPPYQDQSRIAVIAVREDSEAVLQKVRLPGLTGSPLDFLLGVLVLGAAVATWTIYARVEVPAPAWGRLVGKVLACCVTLVGWHLLLHSMSRLL